MIRAIEPADVPAALALVHELAAYELEPDAVEATEDDLHRGLFADPPALHAFVATDAGGAVVGAAFWHLTFSTWTGRAGIHLIDLVVTERARGAGHGAALFGALVALCAERGYARLDWETADALLDAPDRPGPQPFYRRQGGAPRPGWTPWRMDAAALARAAR